MTKWALPPTGGGLFPTVRHLPGASAKMYILKRKPTGRSYDVVNSMVVRAESEEQARGLAASESMDEKPITWFDPEKSSCKIIPIAGRSEVLCKDCNPG